MIYGKNSTSYFVSSSQFLFELSNIEYIVLLARNGGKTIRIIEAGEPGLPSVSILQFKLYSSYDRDFVSLK